MIGKLEDYLRDIGDTLDMDNRVVTYKRVSKSLKVHTNTAKQLLYTFTKQSSKKLQVTYIVAGQTDSDDGLGFRLVHESHLEETKKIFNKITSIHVYSIQKAGSINEVEIYNVDNSCKLADEITILSSIVPGEYIRTRQANSQVNIPVSTKPDEKLVEKTVEEKKAGSAKDKTIGVLFAKQEAGKKLDFVQSQTNKNKVVLEGDNTNSNYEDTVWEKQRNVPASSLKEKTESRNKRKKAQDRKESDIKRRKRIVVEYDSDNSAEEQDANEHYPRPEPKVNMELENDKDEIILTTPLQKGRKRVTKYVDRIFEDEEGFIITKKECIVESCSDGETENNSCCDNIDKNNDSNEIASKTSAVTGEVKKGARLQNNMDKSSKRSDPDHKMKKSAKNSAKQGPAVPSSSIKKQPAITNFFKKKD